MYPAHISKARGVGTFCAFDAKNRDQMITKLKEKGVAKYSAKMIAHWTNFCLLS